MVASFDDRLGEFGDDTLRLGNPAFDFIGSRERFGCEIIFF